MKRLIINADDFGLTPGVDRGILRAHQHGVVTSASVMANSPDLFAAVTRLRQVPSLDLDTGCHVVFVDGAPVSPASEVQTLLDGRAGQVQFRAGFKDLALALLRGKVSRRELVDEACAQIRRLQDMGLRVTHLDSHMHSHVLPAVLEALLAAAKECGVPALRNPFEPLGTVPRRQVATSFRTLGRYVASASLQAWRDRFRNEVDRASLATTDGTLGVVLTGSLNFQLLKETLASLRPGTWELVCHPGLVDEALRGRTDLCDSRAQELEMLTSPELREYLSTEGFELASYRALSSAAPPPELSRSLGAA